MTKEQKREIRQLADFDEIKIFLPDKSVLKVSIADHILINKDVPADIQQKMAEVAAKYARWGVINADLTSYLKVLEDELDIFEKQIMSEARAALGKATEGAVKEKAILSNTGEYLKKRKKIQKVEKAIDKVKKVMIALEMMANMAQSINATYKKEMDLSRDRVITKGGSLKNKKSRGRK